jgi:hypothetical protein
MSLLLKLFPNHFPIKILAEGIAETQFYQDGHDVLDFIIVPKKDLHFGQSLVEKLSQNVGALRTFSIFKLDFLVSPLALLTSTPWRQFFAFVR